MGGCGSVRGGEVFAWAISRAPPSAASDPSPALVASSSIVSSALPYRLPSWVPPAASSDGLPLISALPGATIGAPPQVRSTSPAPLTTITSVLHTVLWKRAPGFNSTMLVSPLVRRSAFLSLAREVVGRKVRVGFASVGAMAELDQVATWANCGAMSLTGRIDGPPLAGPAGLVDAAASVAADLAAMTKRLGHEVAIDGPSLLAERAAFAGLQRRGSVSVGGAARFERCGDGWVVLNLPRPDDVAALPALVEAAVDPDDWEALRRSSAVDRPLISYNAGVCSVWRSPGPTSDRRRLPRGTKSIEALRDRSRRPIVLDFSSLWAGPLAGSFLADAGARVIKVEGEGRPDGARSGPAAFFDLLNAGKETITIDFADRSDQALLRRMVAAADLVIEASRPRDGRRRTRSLRRRRCVGDLVAVDHRPRPNRRP